MPTIQQSTIHFHTAPYSTTQYLTVPHSDRKEFGGRLHGVDEVVEVVHEEELPHSLVLVLFGALL